LKKAGFFGGTISVSDEFGTRRIVLPSLILEASYCNLVGCKVTLGY
jgi:hypothetical protein